MLKLFLLSLSLVSLFGQTPAPRTPEMDIVGTPAPGEILFSITPRSNDGQAQLSLVYGERRGRNQNSGPEAWDQLLGFDRAALEGVAPAPVAFRLERSAGVVACSGQAAQGRATGSCRFDADAAFGDTLAGRVGERPETRHLYQLALSDFRLETLDELARHGYRQPDLESVIGAGIHGVDADFVRDMAASGYRLGTVDQLTGFAIHGVTRAYIAEMAAVGPTFAGLDADDLMAASIHGVTPAFVREMAALGYGNEPADQFVAMKIHGVTPEYVRALAAAGYRGLPAETLVAFAIHGVTPAFIAEMAEAGVWNPGADQLVSLRTHGGRRVRPSTHARSAPALRN